MAKGEGNLLAQHKKRAMTTTLSKRLRLELC